MNVAQHIERAARLFPAHPAILFEGSSLCYAELNGRANRVTNALIALGIRPGDRVALFLPNIPDFAVCYCAILKAGAIAVSINALYKSEEVRHILNDSGARIIFSTSELLPCIPVGECPVLEQVVVCSGDPAGYRELRDISEKASGEARALSMARDDAAVLLYTSGTTGAPKGAVLSHGNIVSNIYTSAHHGGYRQQDRMMLFLPLFHVFGQNHIMNATFNSCATLVLHSRFVPDRMLESIQRDRVTMFFAVPTVFITLLDLDLSNYDLSSLRYEFSAAACLPEEVSRRWTDRFGRRVFEGYGLTESSPFACYNHDFQHRFGSVGSPGENVEVKVVDDQDNEAPRGQLGEICIKSPGVMKGYWGKPEESARALRGGWLHTGDIGSMDDDDYLYIADRLKDMINISGFKVWPAEVERVLYQHPSVKEAAVFGISDARKGEKVGAAIVLKGGENGSSEDIVEFCRKRLAVYKAPSVINFVSELPKSSTGKILKRVLRGEFPE
jgi:long-chain acyl-CoA synthetase